MGQAVDYPMNYENLCPRNNLGAESGKMSYPEVGLLRAKEVVQKENGSHRNLQIDSRRVFFRRAAVRVRSSDGVQSALPLVRHSLRFSWRPEHVAR